MELDPGGTWQDSRHDSTEAGGKCSTVSGSVWDYYYYCADGGGLQPHARAPRMGSRASWGMALSGFRGKSRCRGGRAVVGLRVRFPARRSWTTMIASGNPLSTLTTRLTSAIYDYS